MSGKRRERRQHRRSVFREERPSDHPSETCRCRSSVKHRRTTQGHGRGEKKNRKKNKTCTSGGKVNSALRGICKDPSQRTASLYISLSSSASLPHFSEGRHHFAANVPSRSRSGSSKNARLQETKTPGGFSGKPLPNVFRRKRLLLPLTTYKSYAAEVKTRGDDTTETTRRM